MSGEKPAPPACGCRRCLRERDARDAEGWPILLGMMVVCSMCSDKRCPAAFDHRSRCEKQSDFTTAKKGTSQ